MRNSVLTELAPQSPRPQVWPFMWRWIAAAASIAAGAAVVGYLTSTQELKADIVRPVVATPAPSLGASAVPSPSGRLQPTVSEAASETRKGSAGELAWPLWEFRLQDPLPAREQPLTPVPWRLLGAALFDGRWHAIVQQQGAAAPEYYKTGEKLPGGYVIQSITQDDLTLRAGRREIVLAYIGSR